MEVSDCPILDLVLNYSWVSSFYIKFQFGSQRYRRMLKWFYFHSVCLRPKLGNYSFFKVFFSFLMLSDLQLSTKRWRHFWKYNFWASFCFSNYLVIITPEKAFQRASILHLFFHCLEKESPNQRKRWFCGWWQHLLQLQTGKKNQKKTLVLWMMAASAPTAKWKKNTATAILYFQFCDIENLAKIFPKIAKIVEFTLEKRKRKTKIISQFCFSGSKKPRKFLGKIISRKKEKEKTLSYRTWTNF